GIATEEALCEWRLSLLGAATSTAQSETKCTSALLARTSNAAVVGQRVALTKAICSPFEAIHAVIALNLIKAMINDARRTLMTAIIVHVIPLRASVAG